jgi:hypothetical protein
MSPAPARLAVAAFTERERVPPVATRTGCRAPNLPPVLGASPGPPSHARDVRIGYATREAEIDRKGHFVHRGSKVWPLT